jgi:hypothetical protein
MLHSILPQLALTVLQPVCPCLSYPMTTEQYSSNVVCLQAVASVLFPSGAAPKDHARNTVSHSGPGVDTVCESTLSLSPASFPLPPSLLFFILRLLLFILRLLLFILRLLLFILRLLFFILRLLLFILRLLLFILRLLFFILRLLFFILRLLLFILCLLLFILRLLLFILRLLLFILRLLLFILRLLFFILRLSVLGVWPGLLGALHRRRVHGGLQLSHDFSLQRSAAGRLLPAEVHHLHDRLRGLPCRHRSERERANNTRYCEYHCSNYLF